MNPHDRNPFGPGPQQNGGGQFDWGHRAPGAANPFSQAPMMPTQAQSGQYQQPGQYGQQFAPQQTGYPGQLASHQTGFRPTSAFGAQLQAQMTGYPGYQPQQPQFQTQQPQRQPQFQQQQPQQPYVNDLDPLNIPPNWQSGPSQPVAPALAQAVSTSYKPEDHPRQVVQRHKAGLESWDEYSWRQVGNAYGDLRKSWEGRKAKLMRALDGGLNPQDGEICRKLISEADERIDSMMAATMQLEEARTGFRQSTDAASKSRVRDAINSSLRSLPDWPEELDLSPSAQAQMPQQTGSYQQHPHQTGFQPSYHQGQMQYPQQTGFGYGGVV